MRELWRDGQPSLFTHAEQHASYSTTRRLHTLMHGYIHTGRLIDLKNTTKNKENSKVCKGLLKRRTRGPSAEFVYLTQLTRGRGGCSVSTMGHLFSKKPQSKVTEQDKAVLQLKTTRDKIRQYQKRSEGKLEKDRQLAKQLLRDGKKERAKLLLRKKRFIEEQLKKTDGTLENIERMIEDIEFAQIQMKVADSLKVGNESLKQINAMLDIEDIERILDETQEAAEKQQEISSLLSGGVLTEEDESAVEEELDALIAAAVQKQLPDAPTAAENPEVELPDVPETLPEPQKEKEKREKVALAAS